MSVSNPYWEIVKDFPSGGFSVRDRWEPEQYPEVLAERARDRARFTGLNRQALVERFSFAIPTPDTLEWVAAKLDGRPIVEIGAGTGYWAWMLGQYGIDVLPYDLKPPSRGSNWYHSPKTKEMVEYTDEDRAEHEKQWQELIELYEQSGYTPPEFPPLTGARQVMRVSGEPGLEYVPILEGGTEKAVEHPDRVLLLSWPSYDESWAYEAAQGYAGDTVIYIGEGRGGCTADDAFHDLLDKEFDLVDMCPHHVSWYGIHDRLEWYVRR